MDVREKLVDMIFDSLCRHIDKSCKLAENIADDLISNSVTVQEWISVDERFPEENGRYLTANKRCDGKIDVFDLWFDGGFWYIDEGDDVFDFEVTHWMPLPEPPEEGTV